MSDSEVVGLCLFTAFIVICVVAMTIVMIAFPVTPGVPRPPKIKKRGII